jgi:hypothetical protein
MSDWFTSQEEFYSNARKRKRKRICKERPKASRVQFDK